MDNNYKFVILLAKKNESYTLLELSKQVKIPYTTLPRVVKELSDVTTLITKGKLKLIQIKWNDITNIFVSDCIF